MTTSKSSSLQYNQKMGGVDLADQFNSYYALTKRSYKWWKKVFMHLLLTSVTNAYILHQSSEAELLTSRDFRLRLAELFVEGYERSNMIGPPLQKKLPYDYLHTSYSIVGSRSQNVLCVPRGKAESQCIANAHRIVARRVYHHSQLPLSLFAYQIYVNMTWMPAAIGIYFAYFESPFYSLQLTYLHWSNECIAVTDVYQMCRKLRFSQKKSCPTLSPVNVEKHHAARWVYVDVRHTCQIMVW